MELILAVLIGLLIAGGVFLILRATTFPVIAGLSLLSYAVNLFLFASGRLALQHPPILEKAATGYTDPLPQALVLTAIVISFGMTAVLVILALGSYLTAGTDSVDLGSGDAP